MPFVQWTCLSLIAGRVQSVLATQVIPPQLHRKARFTGRAQSVLAATPPCSPLGAGGAFCSGAWLGRDPNGCGNAVGAQGRSWPRSRDRLRDCRQHEIRRRCEALQAFHGPSPTLAPPSFHPATVTPQRRALHCPAGDLSCHACVGVEVAIKLARLLSRSSDEKRFLQPTVAQVACSVFVAWLQVAIDRGAHLCGLHLCGAAALPAALLCDGLARLRHFFDGDCRAGKGRVRGGG